MTVRNFRYWNRVESVKIYVEQSEVIKHIIAKQIKERHGVGM